jgi:serine/threonine-protein kinase
MAIPKAAGQRPAATRAVKAVIPPVPVVPRPQATDAARAQPRPMVGRVIGEKYNVTGLIGEGGMGAVYEAEHIAIGRRVAVKVLHPRNAQSREAVTRLHHEARVVGTIGHPNICEIYDIGRLDDGSPYLVMERLHGETLAERILREGRVAPQDLIDVMVQVLSALVVAHEKGIIHRDLKPDNIFLSKRAGMPPIAKLLDFGISKATSIEDSAVNITRTGMVMGTPYYMAPEQARGERTLDHRVDLWAAGVILYEGLSGRRPFVARNYNALLVQILTSRHRAIGELVTGLPAGIVEAVDRALSKMREDRFQSATEFQERLMAVRRVSRSAPPAPSALVAPPAVAASAADTRAPPVAASMSPVQAPLPPAVAAPPPLPMPAPRPIAPPAPPAATEARFGQGRPLFARGAPIAARPPAAPRPVLEAPLAAPRPAPEAPPERSEVPAPSPSNEGTRVMPRRPNVPVIAHDDTTGNVPAVRPRVPVFARDDVAPNGAEARPRVPVVIRDESSSDDATIVLPRRPLMPSPPSVPTIDLDDDESENTVVDDPPSFLAESVTLVTKKPSGPG